jgi:hypothetical protein
MIERLLDWVRQTIRWLVSWVRQFLCRVFACSDDGLGPGYVIFTIGPVETQPTPPPTITMTSRSVPPYIHTP